MSVNSRSIKDSGRKLLIARENHPVKGMAAALSGSAICFFQPNRKAYASSVVLSLRTPITAQGEIMNPIRLDPHIELGLCDQHLLAVGSCLA
jgi:hypothetical protein